MLIAGVLLFGGIGGGGGVITVNSSGRLNMQIQQTPVLIASINQSPVLTVQLRQTPVLTMQLRSV
jgi:hypothetical protein